MIDKPDILYRQQKILSPKTDDFKFESIDWIHFKQDTYRVLEINMFWNPLVKVNLLEKGQKFIVNGEKCKT